MKLHFKTKSGIKNLSGEKANNLTVDADYACQDLVNHLDQGKTA